MALRRLEQGGGDNGKEIRVSTTRTILPTPADLQLCYVTASPTAAPIRQSLLTCSLRKLRNPSVSCRS